MVKNGVICSYLRRHQNLSTVWDIKDLSEILELHMRWSGETSEKQQQSYLRETAEILCLSECRLCLKSFRKVLQDAVDQTS